MSLLRRENPTPFPEGERVVSVPFEHRGVVHKPSSFGCTIILDEPMKHTDRIHSSWDEVHREGDFDIDRQQWYVDDAKEEVQDIQAAIRRLEKELTEAKANLKKERAEMRKVKKRYA